MIEKYPYELKHMCGHCEDKYEWNEGFHVDVNGEMFSGHEKCMHVVYAKFKERGGKPRFLTNAD